MTSGEVYPVDIWSPEHSSTSSLSLGTYGCRTTWRQLFAWLNTALYRPVEEWRYNSTLTLLLAMDGPEWKHHVPTVLPLVLEPPVTKRAGHEEHSWPWPWNGSRSPNSLSPPPPRLLGASNSLSTPWQIFTKCGTNQCYHEFPSHRTVIVNRI